MGLLEVVALDLLELLASPLAKVDLLRPVDEALVEFGARALQQAVVRGVADQDVREPIVTSSSSWRDVSGPISCLRVSASSWLVDLAAGSAPAPAR